MTDKKFNNYHIFALFLTNVAAFACDNIYLPSLPNVASDFGISDATAKLTVLFGFAGAILSRCVIGPLSDYFGRKKLFILFLSLCMMGILGCYFAQSVGSFIFFKALEGIGSGAIYVEVISILSDTQTGDKRAKLLGLVELSWPIGWGISPLVGAYLGEQFSWRINFLLLLGVLFCLTLFLAFSMPETLKKDVTTKIKHFSLTKILHSYTNLLKNKLFLSYALMPGLILGGYIVFAVNSPFIYQNYFGYSPKDFALLQTTPLIAYFCTIFVYRFIIAKFGFINAYKVGIGIYCVFTSIILLFLLSFIPASPNSVISIVCFQCCANAFLIPAGATYALQHAQNALGTGASFIAIIRNTVITILIYISNLSSVTINGVFTLIFTTTLLVLLITNIRRKRYKEYQQYTISSRRVGNEEYLDEETRESKSA